MANHRFCYNDFVLMNQTRLVIDRSKGRLEEFASEDIGDNELLQYLCDRTSVLKKLCLISCYGICEEAVAETAKRQPLLEEIQIIFGSFNENTTVIIGTECPQLKTFKLNHLFYSTILTVQGVIVELFDDEEALGIANTMHHLRHLQLIANRMTNSDLRAILDGCPHLETLDIRRCSNVKLDADMRVRYARLKTIRLPEDTVDEYLFEVE